MTTSEYSDWASVLNALAGTTATPLDPAGAANVYAGLPPHNGLDVVGALNYKNGTWTNPLLRLDLNGVCNALAVAHGGKPANVQLEALAALNYILGNRP